MEQVKMRCLECQNLTLVNKVSWLCDDCLDKKPAEKEFFRAVDEAAKKVNKSRK